MLQLVRRRLSTAAAAAAGGTQQLNKLVSASFSRPKPHSSLGEDAHFLSPFSVGVADGVGGWKEEKIDAGQYSRQLMQNCQDIVHRQPDINARTLLQQAVNEVGDTIWGTCTVCLLTADLPAAKVQVANLGDSRFVYLRRNSKDGESNSTAQWQVVGQTKDQTCGFNFPYQIGNYPPGMQAGHKFSCQDADVYDIGQVQRHDLFVLATDGVFDNVFVKEVVSLCNSVDKLSKGKSDSDFVHALAQQIGQHSFACASKPVGDTPFAQYAKNNNLSFSGGKMDDISVVVAIVV